MWCWRSLSHVFHLINAFFFKNNLVSSFVYFFWLKFSLSLIIFQCSLQFIMPVRSAQPQSSTLSFAHVFRLQHIPLRCSIAEWFSLAPYKLHNTAPVHFQYYCLLHKIFTRRISLAPHRCRHECDQFLLDRCRWCMCFALGTGIFMTFLFTASVVVLYLK